MTGRHGRAHEKVAYAVLADVAAQALAVLD